MATFVPDYNNMIKAASNIEVERIPLYDHIVSDEVMEQYFRTPITPLYTKDPDEYFRYYCRFFLEHGYDTVSYEECIGPVMPGSGALGGHIKGVIQTREDFDSYPWDRIPDMYFERNRCLFEALRRNMPEGMKAIGGVGNGIFECVQDVVGFEDLCYMKVDDEDLYRDMFRMVGKTNHEIWRRFLDEFSDIFCVCRFGDDLGFKSSTLIERDDILELIIPEYEHIVKLIHSYDRKFLLHSCGCIFSVMDDMIERVHIDAKHSNEDQIAPFPVWVEKYGDRIGNFGGIDTDCVIQLNEKDMYTYIDDVVSKCKGHGGFAFGSGNSIPNYVPYEQYALMNRTIREIRGESL